MPTASVKPRVAILIHGGIGSGHFSQGQPPIQNLVNALAERCSIEVFSMMPANKDFKTEAFRFFTLKWNLRWSVVRWTYLLLKLFSRHRTNPIDVIYSFWGYPSGVLGAFISGVLRRPLVIHLQGGDSVAVPEIGYGVFTSQWRTTLCRWAYSRADRLIALTHFQSRQLAEKGIRANTVVVPYGVDEKLFSFQKKSLDLTSVRFLHVGNHTPVKDQYLMLKVFSLILRYVPATLTVVGADYSEQKLQAWCHSLGISQKVYFQGPVPHTNMNQYYQQADILLHTSYHEAQGMVFLEAAACGTILAGTAVGLLADMGPACAVISYARDPHQLAAEITSLLQDEGKYRRLQKNAHAFAMETNSHGTVNLIFDELLKLCPEDQ